MPKACSSYTIIRIMSHLHKVFFNIIHQEVYKCEEGKKQAVGEPSLEHVDKYKCTLEFGSVKSWLIAMQ